jgi:hypothetical protein
MPSWGNRKEDAVTGRRLTGPEFLAVLAEPVTSWDLDPEGRFLLLPVAERDLAWVLDCCHEHAEGRCHMLHDGGGVLFERAHDLAFVRFACL